MQCDKFANGDRSLMSALRTCPMGVAPMILLGDRVLDLLDERTALVARAEQAERDRDTLAKELRNIADAQPAKWELDMRDQFQQWAQNRARNTLAQVARSREQA